jgi:predicted ArsR family transcriptional regulator
MPTDSSAIEALALLEEPSRHALYRWVVAAGRAVTRDEAAAGAGVSRALAAFHLDRLAGAGLLDTEYRRLSGRTGPGAGRPSKLYRRSEREVGVTVPERRYDVPAELFAQAIERMSGPEPPAALRAVAHDVGEAVGSTARAAAGPRPSRKLLRAALRETLTDRGYEPFESADGEIRFRNCPFHTLVDDHRDLVCGMNLALSEGILAGLGKPGLRARLDPQPGQCCVAIAAGVAPAP